jgi:hypothetical protein
MTTHVMPKPGKGVRTLANPTATTNSPINEGSEDDPNGNDIETPLRNPESVAYWQAACAAMPAMTDEQIATVAFVLRRINARRIANPTDA